MKRTALYVLAGAALIPRQTLAQQCLFDWLVDPPRRTPADWLAPVSGTSVR